MSDSTYLPCVPEGGSDLLNTQDSSGIIGSWLVGSSERRLYYRV